MFFNDYLFNLANISNGIGYSLAYGHGNIAVTEINSLKALIAKSEEMIPVLEAEACIMEAEEVDREDRSFNYWMTMLYGNDSVSSIDIHNTNKANRLKRRKQNKKHHKSDRYHGKCFEGRNEEGKRIYKDRYCRNPVSDKAHYHSALKAEAREQDYFCTPSISEMKIEKEEKLLTEKESHILDNHYAIEEMLSDFKEGKYIFLMSCWNGRDWEDSYSETNKFCGIKTTEEIKDIILKEQTGHFHLAEKEMETMQGMEGVSFKWEGYYLFEERGFTKFTFLYLTN